MKRNIFYLTITAFVFLCSLDSIAQSSIKDSAITIPMFSGHYAYHFSGGDISDKFGNNHAVGADFSVKTNKNLIFGIDYTFIFGESVKNELDYFHAIRTTSGNLIDGNGQYAEIYMYERGFRLDFNIGYQFSNLGPNPNSGIMVNFGLGFLQHYTRIENRDNITPQVVDDYAKLYDGLSNGFCLTEFIGYRYFSNNKLWNFYVGVEFSQAWTKSRRSYNVDIMGVDDANKMDLLSGVRVGWIIPLYGRAPKNYYYN